MDTEYLFNTGTDPGQQQVNALAAMLDGTTTELFDNIGVQSGWHCLDLGAGNGSIARWLARRVGPTGSVTAVDVDTTYLEPGPDIDVYQHDINDGLPSAGPFDLIHARLLLMHLSRRAEILSFLAAALAPGGWLVIGEISDRLPTATGTAEPADEALFERVLDVGMNGVARPAGMNLEWSRKVARHMHRAGLEGIHGVEHAFTAAGSTPGLVYYRSLLTQLEPRLLNAGLTETELRRFYALMSDPGFTAWSYQFLFTWGHRPRAS